MLVYIRDQLNIFTENTSSWTSWISWPDYIPLLVCLHTFNIVVVDVVVVAAAAVAAAVLQMSDIEKLRKQV